MVTATGHNTIQYTVDDGYPVPDLAINPRFDTDIVHIILWDAVTGTSVCKDGSCKKNVPKDTPPIHLGNRSYEVSEPLGVGEVGQIVTIGPRVGHTVLLSNCTRCTV